MERSFLSLNKCEGGYSLPPILTKPVTPSLVPLISGVLLSELQKAV